MTWPPPVVAPAALVWSGSPVWAPTCTAACPSRAPAQVQEISGTGWAGMVSHCARSGSPGCTAGATWSRAQRRAGSFASWLWHKVWRACGSMRLHPPTCCLLERGQHFLTSAVGGMVDPPACCTPPTPAAAAVLPAGAPAAALPSERAGHPPGLAALVKMPSLARTGGRLAGTDARGHRHAMQSVMANL